jgi:hypothetical protein
LAGADDVEAALACFTLGASFLAGAEFDEAPASPEEPEEPEEDSELEESDEAADDSDFFSALSPRFASDLESLL